MAQFHGGFLVRRVEPGIHAPVYQAVTGYLTHYRSSLAGRGLLYAHAPDLPVVLVAVTGGPSDGKGFAFWHYDNARLGERIAEEVGSEVWTYAYEDPDGWEVTIRHQPAPNRPSTTFAMAREDAAEELGLLDDVATPDLLLDQMPIGRLARELGVSRHALHTLHERPTSTRCALDEPLDPNLLVPLLARTVFDDDRPTQPDVSARN